MTQKLAKMWVHTVWYQRKFRVGTACGKKWEKFQLSGRGMPNVDVKFVDMF